jgi:hypothetical protein
VLSSRRERRARAQRGSVLSALLIIIAFLAILIGALMSELSSSFLVTHTQADRIATEATLDSSVEYAIGNLEERVVTNQVPVYCSRDTPATLSPVLLNSAWATAIGTSLPASCRAIVPDGVAQLDPGMFSADGAEAVINGRDVYLVADSSGHLYAYQLGQKLWTYNLNRNVTGRLGQSPAGTLVPEGGAVALIDDNTVSLGCSMSAAGTVTSQPGFENPPGPSPNFPNYTFFGDSAETLYAYGPPANGTCEQMAASSQLGGAVVGGPLVFSGTVTTTIDGDEDGQITTTTADAFALVNGGGSSRVLHYSYAEQAQDSGTTQAWTYVEGVSLPFANAAGVAFSTVKPVDRGVVRLAVTSMSGQVAMVTINVRNKQSGWTYTLSQQVPAVSLGGSFTRAPYWCHCPDGDLIGAGNQSGSLFVLDAALNQRLRYDGPSPINTTPAGDPNTGDWYYGANNGYVYNVEPLASGTVCLAQMNCVSRFGPLPDQATSSPIVVSPSGCSDRVCLYFGTGSSTYFARIGSLRVMDLRACLTSGSTSTDCAGNSEARLWARVEVGDTFYNVMGWSYYSNGQ